MALRDPECDEDYFELSDTDLEVVVPNMYFSGVERGDDPRFGGVEAESLDTCAFGLKF